MKRACTAVFVCLAALASSGAGAPESAGWTLARETDDVRVSVRDVPGSDIRAVRVVGKLAASPDVILAALADLERYPEFMPPVRSIGRIRRQGPSVEYYMVIDPPVIACRDGCTRVDYTRHDAGFRITWQPAETCPAADDDLVRLVANRGAWDLHATGDGGCIVTYEVHVDPGGNLPDWLVNRVAVSSGVETVEALREVVADARYTRCAGQIAVCLPWM